jgi:hypothetical protein
VPQSASSATVRANPLNTIDETDADCADAKIPTQSPPEKAWSPGYGGGLAEAQSLAFQGLATAKRGHDCLSAFWAELTPDERKAADRHLEVLVDSDRNDDGQL